MTRLREWFANLPLTLAWHMVATANAERDHAVDRAVRADLERDAAAERARKTMVRLCAERATSERLRRDMACWMDMHPVRGDQ